MRLYFHLLFFRYRNVFCSSQLFKHSGQKRQRKVRSIPRGRYVKIGIDIYKKELGGYDTSPCISQYIVLISTGGTIRGM